MTNFSSDKEIDDAFKEITSGKNPEVQAIDTALPETLSAFLLREIPAVEFWIDGVIQKSGKTIVSAPTNVGKSLFVQNLALVMTAKQESFLKAFEVKPGRVLYIDCEMSESAVKERFVKMCEKEGMTKTNDDLFVRSLPSMDILSEQNFDALKKWIIELKIDVLILDPMANTWTGNENDAEDIGNLLMKFNTLIEETKVAIVVVHHHRKASKEHEKSAVGERASGSYRLTAWCDVHVCLQGMPESVTISCEKSRNRKRFTPILANIGDDLWFQFISDFEPTYGVANIEKLWIAMGKPEEFSIAEMCEKASEIGKKDQEIPKSHNTIKRLLEESPTFELFMPEGKKKGLKARRKPGVSLGLFEGVDENSEGFILDGGSDDEIS